MCNARHSVKERFCRWMLTVADRIGSDEFEMTQETIATMLGTRRPGITTLAGSLRSAGLLNYSRGKIQLQNRAGLEKIACECYGAVRERFERLA